MGRAEGDFHGQEWSKLEVAARDATIGEPPPSLAGFLTACGQEHQGALAALSSGNLPAGRGPQETAELLRGLAAQLAELGSVQRR